MTVIACERINVWVCRQCRAPITGTTICIACGGEPGAIEVEYVRADQLMGAVKAERDRIVDQIRHEADQALDFKTQGEFLHLADIIETRVGQ